MLTQTGAAVGVIALVAFGYLILGAGAGLLFFALSEIAAPGTKWWRAPIGCKFGWHDWENMSDAVSRYIHCKRCDCVSPGVWTARKNK